MYVLAFLFEWGTWVKCP